MNFLAQNLSERHIPDSSIIKLWRQITSVLTQTEGGGTRMGPSEGLCGRGRKKWLSYGDKRNPDSV